MPPGFARSSRSISTRCASQALSAATPLIGWVLVVMSYLARRGFSNLFHIRVPVNVAATLTTLLVFEVLWVTPGLRTAAAAALLVACSPVLFIISGAPSQPGSLEP